jgi:hypothetical protein
MAETKEIRHGSYVCLVTNYIRYAVTCEQSLSCFVTSIHPTSFHWTGAEHARRFFDELGERSNVLCYCYIDGKELFFENKSGLEASNQ